MKLLDTTFMGSLRKKSGSFQKCQKNHVVRNRPFWPTFYRRFKECDFLDIAGLIQKKNHLLRAPKWSSVRRFQFILINCDFLVAPANFGGPGKFWPKRRRRPSMARGWIYQMWVHIHDETPHGDAENDFCKKSWGCYHVAVVQIGPSFRRFDPGLTRAKMDAQVILETKQLPKCEPLVP